MSAIKRTVTLSKRVNIDGGAWLEREGNSVRIRYDYAGRVTKEDQSLYVHDIAELAQFVRETDDAVGQP